MRHWCGGTEVYPNGTAAHLGSSHLGRGVEGAAAAAVNESVHAMSLAGLGVAVGNVEAADQWPDIVDAAAFATVAVRLRIGFEGVLADEFGAPGLQQHETVKSMKVLTQTQQIEQPFCSIAAIDSINVPSMPAVTFSASNRLSVQIEYVESFCSNESVQYFHGDLVEAF